LIEGEKFSLNLIFVRNKSFAMADFGKFLHFIFIYRRNTTPKTTAIKIFEIFFKKVLTSDFRCGIISELPQKATK
jgi:hypothetical protein